MMLTVDTADGQEKQWSCACTVVGSFQSVGMTDDPHFALECRNNFKQVFDYWLLLVSF